MSDFVRKKFKIKDGWHEAGRTGVTLGVPVLVEQLWTPILFDDEEDPDFLKTAAIEEQE